MRSAIFEGWKSGDEGSRRPPVGAAFLDGEVAIEPVPRSNSRPDRDIGGRLRQSGRRLRGPTCLGATRSRGGLSRGEGELRVGPPVGKRLLLERSSTVEAREEGREDQQLPLRSVRSGGRRRGHGLPLAREEGNGLRFVSVHRSHSSTNPPSISRPRRIGYPRPLALPVTPHETPPPLSHTLASALPAQAYRSRRAATSPSKSSSPRKRRR